ncbi:MAG: hypothetical protein H6573_36260 [Lewinellaceae bacterium]|nr:hypothetical protein [Lewinellaceae bacterium]
MVDRVVSLISELVKSQGFLVVFLTGVLVWSQYNYMRLEQKIDNCNQSVVRMYEEDRKVLIGVLNEATRAIEKIDELCGD